MTGNTQETVREDERLDDLQFAGLHILQKKSGFCFGMDAVLLADFARIHPSDRVVDLGTGTGILPLLLCGRGKGSTFDALEIQQDMADMAARSVQWNGLEDRITVHPVPVERIREILPVGSRDAVVCNPPYHGAGTSLPNPDPARNLARHQGEGGLDAFLEAARWVLRVRGKLFMIYPAQRMLEAMQAMDRVHITPKRFRMVYPAVNRGANLVLLEGVRDARPSLHTEPPLIVYGPDGQMTEELRTIYHMTGPEDV